MKMRIAISKSACLAAAMGICLASVFFGQTTTFKELAPPGPPSTGFYLNGEYTSPYYATITNGPTVPVICDDYIDQQSAGQSWNVLTTDLSAFKGNNDVQSVYYGTTASTTPTPDAQTTDYIAAAILATEILGYQTAVLPGESNSQLINPSTSETPDLSYALWALFNPVALTDVQNCNNLPYSATNTHGSTSGTCGPGDGPTSSASMAQGYLTAALTEAATFANGAAYEASESQLLGHSVDVKIYSESANDNNSCVSDCTAATNPPGRYQEFVGVNVPEPSTWGVLAFDFVGAGIVGLYFRRRQSRVRS
jgi:hypothetical protein